MSVNSENEHAQPIAVDERGGGSLSAKGIDGMLQVIPSTQYGAWNVYILDPDDADAADANAERINNSTGFKAFRATPLMPGVINTIAVIIGWSTTASDLTNINSAMSDLDGYITTPSTGGSAVTNCIALIPDVATPTQWSPSPWITWDGSDTIKTIAVRSSGANYTAGVMIETIS